MTAASEDRSDFFVSYTQADRAWAEWIAWQLEAEGYSTILQSWHFRPGDNFVLRMRDALEQADRTIAVLSPSYLASRYGTDEWTAAFIHEQDQTGRQRLLPVRVEVCALPLLLATLIYIDLTGANRQTARARLLEGVRQGPVLPIEEPVFPGGRTLRVGLARAEPRFPGPVPEISNLPARNPNFTGRKRLFGELLAKLQPGSPAVVAQAQAVHGLGGVGKTQLALEYAYRHGADYDIVWWITAGQPLAVPDQLVALARRLGISETADQAEAISALQDELRQHDRWLLVFDNAEEPAGLRPWWPPDSGHVIITTRNPAWSAVANTIGVDVLSRAESVAFLRRRTGMNIMHARALAEVLGDLPLALEQAAAYIDQTGATAAEYIELLDRYGPELLDRGQPLDYEYTVTTTWSISVERLRQQAPAAMELLTLCAFLAPDGFPQALLAQYADQLPPTLGRVMAEPLDRKQAIGELRRYSLITVASDALRVHRLVQVVTRDGVAVEEQQRWANVALSLVLAAFPEEPDDADTWPASARLLTHALQVIGYADSDGEGYETDPEATVSLTNRVGDYLDARAEYQQALHLLQRNLTAAEASLGSEHVATAATFAGLASVLWELHDIDNASTCYRRALAIYEQQLDSDDPAIAQVLNGLALVLSDRGDLDGARAHNERALAIYERRLGPDHPRTAWTLSILGTVLGMMGDTDRERICHERALAIRERCFGPNHPATAWSVSKLGSLLQAQGDLHGARGHYERALAIREARLGPNHPETASSLQQLGDALQAQGDLAGARSRYEGALAIYEAAYGPDHPGVATDLSALAGVLLAQGDLAGACGRYERALAIAEAALSPDDLQVAVTLYNLAGVLEAQGDLDGARGRYERALAIAEAALSPDDLQLATLHDSLAGVLEAQGDLDGARRRHERALAIRETRLGPRVRVIWLANDAVRSYCISIYNHEQWVGGISNTTEHGYQKLMLRSLQDRVPSGDHLIIIGAEDDLLDSLDNGSVLLSEILHDPRVQLLYDDVLDSGIVIGIQGSALDQLPQMSTEQSLRIRIEPSDGMVLSPANIVVAAENDLYVSFPHWPDAIEKVSYTIDDNRFNIIVRPGGEGLKLRKSDVRFTRGLEYAGLPEPDISRLQRRKGRGPVQLVVSLPYQEGAVERVSYKLQDGFLHIVVRANHSFWPLDPDSIAFKTIAVLEEDS